LSKSVQVVEASACGAVGWDKLIEEIGMASVLVTGANGFVGGYTVAAFGAAGWDVRGTVRGNDGVAVIPMSVVADLGVDDWLPILAGVKRLVFVEAIYGFC
jgi:nucleoside-diphosphate-sugar epimerase